MKIKDCCTVIVPMRDKPKTFEGDIPWCRIDDFTGKYLSGTQSNQYVSKETVERMHLHVLPAGTVLCAVTGASIGTYAITTKPLVTNQTFAGIVCGSKAYNEYIYYFLKIYTNVLINISVGCAQAYITRDAIENIEIGDLTIEEQKGRVKVLKELDDKIENNNVISSQLESLAKTIYDYWFLQFDFPDENGRPYKSSGGKMVWNEELKREIPEGWKTTTLGKMFAITMGSSPKGESLNENGEGIEFHQGSTDFGGVYPNRRVFTTAPIRTALSQDVLLSVRAPVGDMNIAMNDCCIGRGLAAVHHESALFAWNTIRTLQPYFDVYNNNGTTFGALTADSLKEQLVSDIPQPLVKAYTKSICDAEKAIRNIELENRQLSSLREFLLPMLMNGQVTFKEDA